MSPLPEAMDICIKNEMNSIISFTSNYLEVFLHLNLPFLNVILKKMIERKKIFLIQELKLDP